ncbi:hypothetical protein C8R45DRAFT_1210503 [Mycena sanguinolenta]|nr:hypothetical protein C8R45DRAFT_1210503 [Mycena sanguinolenta]
MLGGGKAHYIVANVGSKAGCDALIAEFKKRESNLHVLVNNSGIHYLGRKLSKFPREGLGQRLAVNVNRIFYMTAGVNAILPGYFPSKMTAFGLKAAGEEIRAKVQPTGRLGKMEDMAGVALFFAPLASARVTRTLRRSPRWKRSHLSSSLLYRVTVRYPPALLHSSFPDVDVHCLFPDVEQECITQVTAHKLEAMNLFRLAPERCREKTLHRLRGTEFTIDGIYPSLTDVLLPLYAFFGILTVHLASRDSAPDAAVYFNRYLTHLMILAEQYEWRAVLAYHVRFFEWRRREMLWGDHGGWGKEDIGLFAERVIPSRSSPLDTIAHVSTRPTHGDINLLSYILLFPDV